MRAFTVHRRGDRLVFVREGFSPVAALFGPLWLLLHRAWIPAVILLALHLAALRLPAPTGAIGTGVLVVLAGLAGNDLRRWQLARRGFAPAGLVAARDQDGARLRHASVNAA